MVAVPKLTFARESVELVRPLITVDGEDVSDTAAYDLAVVAAGARPVTWSAPDTAGDRRGYLTGGLSPDLYDMYIRITDSPERPVQLFARIEIV